MEKVFIGIDPDVDKSGVALWSPSRQELLVNTKKFFDLFDFLLETKRNMSECAKIVVVVEAGWLNKKSNYHGSAYQTKAAGERISKNVGSNHETGRKIVEMCEYLGIESQLVVPTHAKFTKDYFKSITGIEKANQEMIDAGMLVFGRK